MNQLEQATYLQDVAHFLGTISRGAARRESSTEIAVEFQARTSAMYEAARNTYAWRTAAVRDVHRTTLASAHEVAAFHGLAIDDEEAEWFIWNRTAYPFCSAAHMICQLSDHFRSITTKEPT